jgi:hypothetical protein
MSAASFARITERLGEYKLSLGIGGAAEYLSGTAGKHERRWKVFF